MSEAAVLLPSFPGAEALFWQWAQLFGALVAARLAIAYFYARSERKRRCAPAAGAESTASGAENDLTIVQPILGGDPELGRCLEANLMRQPEAEFVWMVDEADAVGRATVEPLLARHSQGAEGAARIRVVLGPEPKDGENPKLAKLLRALPLVRTGRCLVLDDDTVLAGPLAEWPEGPLVTGLPVFPTPRRVQEAVVAGFINGNSAATYLVAAALGFQRTINGMAYAVRTEELREMGGFAAAGHAVTDDYAVAQLYARHGIRPKQAANFVHVHVTVESWRHCAALLRRWMIFARLYLVRNLSVGTIAWVLLPAVMPAAGLSVGWAAGRVAETLLLLLGKAVANRLLLWRLAGLRLTPAGVLFEVVADLLLPVWAAMAAVAPNRMQWRRRKISLQGGEIRYER